MDCNGQRVSLEPLGMGLLIYLSQHAGRVISTSELIEHVWCGQIVSDGTVYQWIHKLRKALGDDSHNPRYIETIPKKGYRLVARVQDLRSRTAKPNERAKRRRLSLAAAALVASVAMVAYVVELSVIDDPSAGMPPTDDTQSIAVLPFENLSNVAEDAYLAAGVHNDLLSHLAKIGSLRVISRTSVLEYEGSSKNLREIGDELGVTAIVEGSVQRVGDSIHVNAQLIDAATDNHLWAEIYDEEMTAESLLAIQTDIATSIAGALHAVLMPEEIARLNEVPTRSMRAYDFYLSGNDYFNRPGFDGVELSLQQYQRAVDEDPGFAQAWAQLSRSHSLMAWSGMDRTDSRWALALATAERARELAPDLGEPHIAMGQYYYMARYGYDRALQEYEIAAQKSPGNVELFRLRAMIQRRVGLWDDALENLARAIDLDPRNLDLLDHQAQNYRILRDYAQAELLWDRVLEIAPDQKDALLNKAINALYSGDSVTEVRTALDHSAAHGADAPYLRWLIALFELDYDHARAILEAWDAEVHVNGLLYVSKLSYHGVTDYLAGRHDDAMRWFDVAAAELRDALAANPDDWRLHLSLGEALAVLGQTDEAVRLARRALELLPASSDRFSAHDLQTQAVLRVFIPAGDHDAALDELEAYFSVPGRWSIDGLVNDPRLDPVREDPRFKALLAKYASR
ncbi:MAG: tetratricopeptide repeat protein [Gammaproteobacteria bacterium]|nr:tetratricopeptide repeat protein [Gammaproteobacteria bacterium]